MGKFVGTIESDAGPVSERHRKNVSNIEMPAILPQAREPENPLRGHKFHHDCLRQWLLKGEKHFYNDSTIFYRCPLCRRDMRLYEDEEPPQEANRNHPSPVVVNP